MLYVDPPQGVRSAYGKEYYDIDFNVPLDTEIKIGYNWLDMEEVEIVK